MRHAYLILAHDDYPLLQVLVNCLDDSRNDIYVHVDLKSNALPNLITRHAGLHILANRTAVYWGDVTVVQAELNLFRAAVEKGGYSYLHLLSGADLPLKNQDEIHNFFTRHHGREFIGYSRGNQTAHITRKVKRWHIYPHSFRQQAGMAANLQRVARAGLLKLQELLGRYRNNGIEFKKGTQWVSVTAGFAEFVVARETEILEVYRNTFCPDEIFIQTLCWNSVYRGQLFNADDEATGCMRYVNWQNGELLPLTTDDLPALQTSPLLFARKFSSSMPALVSKVAEMAQPV